MKSDHAELKPEQILESDTLNAAHQVLLALFGAAWPLPLDRYLAILDLAKSMVGLLAADYLFPPPCEYCGGPILSPDKGFPVCQKCGIEHKPVEYYEDRAAMNLPPIPERKPSRKTGNNPPSR